MALAQNPLEALDSLAWYAQMGVDLCVEDQPQVLKAADIAAVAKTPAPRPFAAELPQPKAAAPATPPTSIADAVAEARKLADEATDLAALEAAVRNFNGCALKKTATNTVFAQGVAASRLMFVGEAPGAEEDRNGVPFCGPSGKLLDRILSFIGLNRAENFYITNTLFWRPPGNRQPSAEELEICRPFVEKHIALVDPKILVLVGGTATSAVLKDTRGITRLRGQVFSYTNAYMSRDVPVHVIYHPSYLLRQPLAKKQAWADLLKLKESLASAQ
jgi:uracil-DNA glycosylase family 4